ncbi:MAG: hypothetical protein JRI35_06340 [Deltaproteobacteria bacterium]|nr:hypothetical protein [Deltaproteobacteria bacterium]MBW1933288.1 hypothetical protein [Deltaproteobacteria bacterium]MBW1966752.1 hypothetical protein [Deltaproteobacteria bacterium]
MLALGRALIINPKMLLMDEPSLDKILMILRLSE